MTASSEVAGPAILVVGEALTDIIRTPFGEREHPGGSPANVALGLARLGVPTFFLTAIGRDRRGQAIASKLAASGVELMPESWSLPQTSTAAAEIAHDGAAAYTFDVSWELPEEVQLPSVRHLHIGSISAFLDPGAGRVEELVLALSASATVSFDPNIRPALLRDRDSALSRFERLASLVDLVKLSDEDAAFLYPDRRAEEAAKTVAALGPTVAVTKGAHGSFLVAGTEAIEIEPIAVSVSDTVGAGDSYMSALLWALLSTEKERQAPPTGRELAKAGTFAAKAAAITVGHHGAEPPTLAEVEGA